MAWWFHCTTLKNVPVQSKFKQICWYPVHTCFLTYLSFFQWMLSIVIEKVHLDDLNVYLDTLDTYVFLWSSALKLAKKSSPFLYKYQPSSGLSSSLLMKTSCLRLKLVELNFFASFNADDQRKTYVSNVSKKLIIVVLSFTKLTYLYELDRNFSSWGLEGKMPFPPKIRGVNCGLNNWMKIMNLVSSEASSALMCNSLFDSWIPRIRTTYGWLCLIRHPLNLALRIICTISLDTFHWLTLMLNGTVNSALRIIRTVCLYFDEDELSVVNCSRFRSKLFKNTKRIWFKKYICRKVLFSVK